MGFSIPHLLVVLAIAVLVFGTKRLRNLGGDLGSAINSFRTAINESETLAAGQEKDADIEFDPSIKEKS